MVELTRTYPMPPHVMVLRYVTILLVRTAAVCGALSLVVLVFGLAVEEGALPLEREVSDGLDAFMRMFMGVAALGGGFGLLIIAGLAHDMYRREQRRVLEELVEDGTATKDQPPVAWQRAAVDQSNLGTSILSFFGIVLGPIILLTSIFTFEGGDGGFSLIVLGVGILITVLAVMGFRGMTNKDESSAKALWGKKLPRLHPLEPPREYDSDGNLKSVGSRQLANTARAKAQLGSAPELQRLDRMDRIATKVMNASVTVLGLCTVLVIVLTVIRQPCRNCEPRTFGATMEGLIDAGLLVAVVLVAVGLLVLVLATLLEARVTLQLRSTILEMAADPESEGPPWFLLRRLLLEETPLQSLTGHLHTIGVICLTIGITGALLQDTYPFSDWTRLFPALMALGGVFLMFHLSGWFWQRDRTTRQNEALLERWPE